MSDISSRNDSISDYSPLSQACIKALTDRMDDKRKFAANEIEKMTAEFAMSNNLIMVNRLIIVLGKHFCLSHHQNTRKGGLLGLAAVMVGFKNGSTLEPPQEMVEEVVRPILTCLLDSDPRVRQYACEALYNATKVSRLNVLPLFESIFDSVSRMVADNDLNVRIGAEAMDKLLKDIVVESKELPLAKFVTRLEEYIYTRNKHTRMFIISWIRLLDSKFDIINHLPHLLDGIFNCLYECTEELRASILVLLSELLNKIVTRPTDGVDLSALVSILLKHTRNDSEGTVQYTAISWIRELILLLEGQDLVAFTPEILAAILPCLAAPSDAVVKSGLRVMTAISRDDDEVWSKFVQALYNIFCDNEVMFERRGTFVLLNLCTMVKAEKVYLAFAEIIKEDKIELKFAYNMVQKLNQILLTTQPLVPLRSRLTSTEDDSELQKLFHALYLAWCHSPVATITLCLLTNNYRLASEIVMSLSKTDVTVELLIQIDWVVQLIESPVFAPLRMRLLDSSINQHLMQALYGLLMILPQSDAFNRLSNRLDQVYKYMNARSSHRSAGGGGGGTQSPQQASSSSTGKESSVGGGGGGGGGKRTPSAAGATSPSANAIDSLIKHYHSVQSYRIKSRNTDGAEGV